MVREYFNKKYTDSKERQYRKLTEQYNVLKHKKNTLRSQIEEVRVWLTVLYIIAFILAVYINFHYHE